MTQWDIVSVLIVLLGLFGTLLSISEKLRKPMQSLTRTSDRLANCVEVMEKRFAEFKECNYKEHDEIWHTVDQHDRILSEHETALAVLKTNREST